MRTSSTMGPADSSRLPCHLLPAPPALVVSFWTRAFGLSTVTVFHACATSARRSPDHGVLSLRRMGFAAPAPCDGSPAGAPLRYFRYGSTTTATLAGVGMFTHLSAMHLCSHGSLRLVVAALR